jgi:hypothetical protein
VRQTLCFLFTQQEEKYASITGTFSKKNKADFLHAIESKQPISQPIQAEHFANSKSYKETC